MAENRPHPGNRRERLAGRLKPAAEHRNKNVLPHIRIFHNLWFSRKMLLTRRCREIALCGSPVMVAKPEVQRVLLVLRQGWAQHVHKEAICAVAINWISYQSSDFPKQEKSMTSAMLPIEIGNSTHKRPLCGHCAPALTVNPANRAAPAACALGDLHSKKQLLLHAGRGCFFTMVAGGLLLSGSVSLSYLMTLSAFRSAKTATKMRKMTPSMSWRVCGERPIIVRPV